ncbi:alpha/beta hydrolase fold protein [Pseudofrankia inefficax]|uniref:Alpha/beta hydrolase fold protein n=1 Tax=Pseudofrankia inefficax (strain DSM 45817 / CECT 9037 / DDB 130130 / EuI1c) TaxID=298654 RepID=E3IZD1_PSEI1|nr:alpha/beta hydrolase fold protein [Pseudofrankia inefficax]
MVAARKGWPVSVQEQDPSPRGDGGGERPPAAATSFTAGGLRFAADRWDPPAGGPRHGLVLLLHGGGQTRHSWRRTGERLAELGWSAVAVDARGHGDTDWDPGQDYSHHAMADDLGEIVAQLGEPPVLVGASMGGITALLAQARTPSLGRALVLVDITPRLEPAGIKHIFEFMTSAPDGFATLEDAADAIAAYNPNRPKPTNLSGLKKNLRLRDGRWHWHWDPAFMKIRDEARRELGDEALPDAHRPDLFSGAADMTAQEFAAEAEKTLQTDALRAAAQAIRVPALLVRGKQSDIVSDEGVTELLELIPHAEYVDVTGAGHMVAGDDNDVFAGRLGDFLTRLPPVTD